MRGTTVSMPTSLSESSRDEPDDTGALKKLCKCLSSVLLWTNTNFLKRNEIFFLIVAPNCARERTVSGLGVLARQSKTEPWCHLRFGTAFVNKTCFYHLRNIAMGDAKKPIPDAFI